MPGQAVVSIDGKQWAVSVASTLPEITAGLSGLESIPQGTGMLFDLGADYKQIQIDMTRMLFPLDIIFINSTQGVVGVMHNVQPGWTDVRFENDILPGARCFLEVNAGEAEGIEYRDNVSISMEEVQPQFWSIVWPILLATMIVLPIVGLLGKGLVKD